MIRLQSPVKDNQPHCGRTTWKKLSRSATKAKKLILLNELQRVFRTEGIVALIMNDEI
jgi:hypothetical protein